MGYAARSRWGPSGGAAWATTRSPRAAPVGTPLIEVVDANATTLVWRAVGRDSLDPNAPPDTRECRIDTVKTKNFARFPESAT